MRALGFRIRMYCAIDFGTSNSAVAVPDAGGGLRLVELEPGQPTMPTAVFYPSEADRTHELPPPEFGRAALAAYVDGLDGRLMRSMKSVLGSALVTESTDVGAGRSVRYLDVVAGYLRHLKARAEAALGASVERAVLGRPVYFVDDDPAADAAAQSHLADAARAAGFAQVEFQYEPIAAAFDYERQAQAEQRVLVADIGGGTSDFSLVRVGPERRGMRERQADILASHGVHVAGTDFDRRLALACILPALGYGARRPARRGEPPREVPSRVYFDLATWHLVNTLYAPARVAEIRQMRAWYAEPRHHARLVRVLEHRLGHGLLARAEAAKIAVADGGHARIDLGGVEAGLEVALEARDAQAWLEEDIARIVRAAHETLGLAGVAAERVDALYLTGGSTGLALLARRLADACPAARVVRGDRFASVATGLGLEARRRFA